MPLELLHKETFLWCHAPPISFWIQMSTASVLVKNDGEGHISDVHGGDFFLLCLGSALAHLFTLLLILSPHPPYHFCCVSVTI